MRVGRTMKALEDTDIAILMFRDCDDTEKEWFKILKDRKIPVVPVLNIFHEREKSLSDNNGSHKESSQAKSRDIHELTGENPVEVNAETGGNVQAIFNTILRKLPENYGTHTITGNLVKEGDTVMLVMPQDSQAPKGRLILPQVQTIRELLDRRCTVVGCTPDRIKVTLQALSSPPQLIITDSQAFSEAWSAKPEESRLTSFSILFAGYKGDIYTFMDGTKALDMLTEESRVLIAEACTHAPATEDIGRVKIPRMLRQRIGQGLRIDIVSGTDFPEDLSGYDLIIHCGACMFNRRYVLNRITSARSRHIPITNYGLTIAWAKGILGKVALPAQER